MARKLFKGYSHVGDILMLVTYSWWQFKNVGDRINILVAFFGCWCPTLILRNKECWLLKWSEPSPTSLNCHSHISSSTSVTNIDVALFSSKTFLIFWIYLGLSPTITYFQYNAFDKGFIDGIIDKFANEKHANDALMAALSEPLARFTKVSFHNAFQVGTSKLEHPSWNIQVGTSKLEH